MLYTVEDCPLINKVITGEMKDIFSNVDEKFFASKILKGIYKGKLDNWKKDPEKDIAIINEEVSYISIPHKGGIRIFVSPVIAMVP